MKRFNRRKHALFAGFLAAGLLGFTNISAYAEPVFNKPVYNEETKSYFELYSPDADNPKINTVRNYGHIRYNNALKISVKRRYKGVRGRLAVIQSKKTHQFLAKILQPSVSAWIGLRYYCRFKKLVWINGTIVKAGKDFVTWGPQIWNVNGPSPRNDKQSTCWNHVQIFYLPVHYWPVADGFQWNANDHAKEFNALIIEYTTGKP